jgi:hypothetical protein
MVGALFDVRIEPRRPARHYSAWATGIQQPAQSEGCLRNASLALSETVHQDAFLIPKIQQLIVAFWIEEENDPRCIYGAFEETRMQKRNPNQLDN